MNKFRYPVDLAFDFINDLATLDGDIVEYLKHASIEKQIAIAACLNFIKTATPQISDKSDVYIRRFHKAWSQTYISIIASDVFQELVANPNGKSLDDYISDYEILQQYFELLNPDLAMTCVNVSTSGDSLNITYKDGLNDWLKVREERFKQQSAISLLKQTIDRGEKDLIQKGKVVMRMDWLKGEA